MKEAAAADGTDEDLSVLIGFDVREGVVEEGVTGHLHQGLGAEAAEGARSGQSTIIY